MVKDFDSIDEYLFAMQLEEIGIKYQSQVSFVIDEGFTATDGHTYRDSVYTPDFVFEFNNKTFVIEVKGFSLYDNPFKYRIADKHFKKLGYEYHKVKLSGSTKDSTKAFYPYSSGKRSKAVQKRSRKESLLRQWFYKMKMIALDYDLKPLRSPKTSEYEGVKHLSFEDIQQKYYIIGTGSSETKWKYIKKN